MKNYQIYISKLLTVLLILIIFIFACTIPVQKDNNKSIEEDSQSLDLLIKNRAPNFDPAKQYIIESVHSGKVIDVAEISIDNGANIHQWTYVGGNNQKWQIADVGNGEVKIISVHSGKSLDVGGWSSENGGNIIQWDYHGGAIQRWKITDVGNGEVKIESVFSGKSLDVEELSLADGGNIQQWEYGGGANQKWRIKEAETTTDYPDFTDVYKIINVHSGKAIDVAGISSNNGANIHQWSYLGGNNQKWRIIKVGDGAYKIESVHSLKVLDVAGGSTANGANVIQWEYLGGNNQKWKIINLGNGHYQIESVHSGKALEVGSWSLNDGGNINIYPWSTYNNQRWRIEPANSTNGKGVVRQYGQLKVIGSQLCDQNGNPVQLKGMSAFWVNWSEGGKYANRNVINWLVDDWGISVYRVAMGVEVSGAYISNPNAMKAIVDEVVQACIDKGIYVIIDWHAHDTTPYKAQEIAFFQEMARKYGNTPNVIYELWNEPTHQSWDNVIKPYCQDVTNAIRQIDPDNIIIVGSSTWSQDVHLQAANRLSGSNIVYTLHFYAGTHTGWLRDRADAAMAQGIAIFASEWGTSAADGGSNGQVYFDESQRWVDWMAQRKISWCNWSICDKYESSAALQAGASTNGGWSDNNLTASGRWIKSKM